MADPEERLFALFDDLEQQAEAAFALEREAEVADRAQAEYAEVTLASRLMASVGEEVSFRLAGAGNVIGRLERVASGWCLLAGDSGGWVVHLPAVQTVAGLSARSIPEAAWPATARLGLRSALRRISAQGAGCRVLATDGATYDVRLGRVGADFVEATRGTSVLALPFAGIAAIRLAADSGLG